jgi:zinc/manganese transport system permease protein
METNFLWNLWANVMQLFEFHFMQNAYLAGTMVALTSGLFGYFMVLRSQSFAGHSLANVGFAGATGAALLGVPAVIGLFVAGLLAALGIQVLNQNERASNQSDIAVGAILTAALALGFLFIFLSTSEYGASVYTVLFGNILGISDVDVRIVAGTSIMLLVALLLCARPLFFVSLDPIVAAAKGVPVRLISLGYLVLLALVVAIAVQVIGALLIFALLVTPAAIAQMITARPGIAAALAAVLATGFTWIGLTIGFFTPYPVSFFITTCAFAAYLLVRVGTLWQRGGARKERRLVGSRLVSGGDYE